MAIDPMDGLGSRDEELSARLRRLDAVAGDPQPGFDYAGLLERQAAKKSRARRRAVFARGSAGALVLAMVAVSVWRLSPPDEARVVVAKPVESEAPQQRLVRADTYLALAAIEDHIATIDDALSDARLVAPRGAEVARLERTRAELMDSYAHVRYAEMVSASF
jgi:hypothetical protein